MAEKSHAQLIAGLITHVLPLVGAPTEAAGDPALLASYLKTKVNVPPKVRRQCHDAGVRYALTELLSALGFGEKGLDQNLFADKPIQAVAALILKDADERNDELRRAKLLDRSRDVIGLILKDADERLAPHSIVQYNDGAKAALNDVLTRLGIGTTGLDGSLYKTDPPRAVARLIHETLVKRVDAARIQTREDGDEAAIEDFTQLRKLLGFGEPADADDFRANPTTYVYKEIATDRNAFVQAACQRAVADVKERSAREAAVGALNMAAVQLGVDDTFTYNTKQSLHSNVKALHYFLLLKEAANRNAYVEGARRGLLDDIATDLGLSDLPECDSSEKRKELVKAIRGTHDRSTAAACTVSAKTARDTAFYDIAQALGVEEPTSPDGGDLLTALVKSIRAWDSARVDEAYSDGAGDACAVITRDAGLPATRDIKECVAAINAFQREANHKGLRDGQEQVLKCISIPVPATVNGAAVARMVYRKGYLRALNDVRAHGDLLSYDVALLTATTDDVEALAAETFRVVKHIGCPGSADACTAITQAQVTEIQRQEWRRVTETLCNSMGIALPAGGWKSIASLAEAIEAHIVFRRAKVKAVKPDSEYQEAGVFKAPWKSIRSGSCRIGVDHASDSTYSQGRQAALRDTLLAVGLEPVDTVSPTKVAKLVENKLMQKLAQHAGWLPRTWTSPADFVGLVHTKGVHDALATVISYTDIQLGAEEMKRANSVAGAVRAYSYRKLLEKLDIPCDDADLTDVLAVANVVRQYIDLGRGVAMLQAERLYRGRVQRAAGLPDTEELTPQGLVNRIRATGK